MPKVGLQSVIVVSLHLVIHEECPRPKRGVYYSQMKILVNHSIGHIPLLYKKVIKDQI